MEATARMKEGLNCDLLDRLALDPAFPLDREEITAVLDPTAFIGICPEQVEEFVAEARARISGLRRRNRRRKHQRITYKQQ